MITRKFWIGGLGMVATSIGLVGILHMPFARGLLMRAGGCPVGNASTAEIEPARREALKGERGIASAPARPALGFVLDKTTHADMDRWAEKSHVSCHEEKGGLFFCNDVPAAALGLPEADGPVGEVHFAFNSRGVLFDIATMRSHATLQPLLEIQTRLAVQVGEPQKRSGAFDDAHLAPEGPKSLATVSYHYSDYVAEVIAMRFPADGLVVREHYMSAND